MRTKTIHSHTTSVGTHLVQGLKKSCENSLSAEGARCDNNNHSSYEKAFEVVLVSKKWFLIRDCRKPDTVERLANKRIGPLTKGSAEKKGELTLSS